MESLEMARKITLNNNNTPITIFSDSREALIAIRQLTSGTSSPYLRNLIYQRNLDLGSNGHFVTIRWIPGHVGLIGHDKADQSAKDKAGKGGKPLEQWSSLSHIKKKLNESKSQELARWHEIKTQERESSRRGFYVPWIKGKINGVLGNTSKKYALRYF